MHSSTRNRRLGARRRPSHLSSSTPLELHRSAQVSRPSSLRRTRPQVIIRDSSIGKVGRAQTRRDDLARRDPTTPADILYLPAMLDQQSAVDRSSSFTAHTTSITELLADLRGGRREAFDQILPLVYHELRRAARRELAIRPSDSLSTTALVHELYLKFSRAGRT